MVEIQIGPPAPRSTVKVPVHWYRDLVMAGGGGEIPGVDLHYHAPPTPPGLNIERWNFMLEVISYAINEGPIMGDEHEADDDYDDPDSGTALPYYRWRFMGGDDAFDRWREWAETNASSWRAR